MSISSWRSILTSSECLSSAKYSASKFCNYLSCSSDQKKDLIGPRYQQSQASAPPSADFPHMTKQLERAPTRIDPQGRRYSGHKFHKLVSRRRNSLLVKWKEILQELNRFFPANAVEVIQADSGRSVFLDVQDLEKQDRFIAYMIDRARVEEPRGTVCIRDL